MFYIDNEIYLNLDVDNFLNVLNLDTVAEQSLRKKWRSILD